MNKVDVYIEGQKIDLFDDETININSSVQNINDISKVFTDFSQAFTVPSSRNNNKIFKHYYNADITTGFDARTKKKAEIYIKNNLYKKGKIRLTSTKLKDNLIVSYTIQFEGDIINIKDVLGDDKLSVLDLSDYNHEYNSNNIKQGLETSLFTENIVYPLISPERRFLYDSSDTITSDDNQVNIHYNAGIVDNSIEYTELKPAIKLSALIDQIQEQYNLDFIGDFFNRDYYTNAYVWLNKDEGRLRTISQTSDNIIDWDGGDNTYVDFTTNVFTPIAFVAIGAQPLVYFDNTVTITPSVGFEDVPYNIVILKNGTESSRLNNVTGINELNFKYTAEEFPSSTADFTFFIETQEGFSYSANLLQKRYTNATSVDINTTSSLNVITGLVQINKQVPDIKIYDFLVGIIKMFNIALTSNIDSQIIWDILPEWYNKGKVFKSFEKYINVESTDIKRGKLNNEFKFNFVEPKTLLAEQFKSNTGVAFGDLEAKLLDEDGELLDGTRLEIKLPFENIVYERILDSDSNTFTPMQYGYAVNKEQSPVVTAPVIFYNNNVSVTDVGFLNDVGVNENLNSNINIPSHSVNVADETTQTCLFGSEISTYTFNIMETSLYNSSYKDYVTDMFSNQRRVYSYEAVIPPHILQQINLNDRLIILNKRYIINSISAEITKGNVKLELLNDIYTSGELLSEGFYVSPTINFASMQENTYTATVYSNRNLTISNFDEGFGIFVTINSPLNISNIATINYTVADNTLGDTRTQSILIEDDDSSESIKLTITQSFNGIIRFDSTVITFDNNILTFDKI